jgi:hypothetical protein
MLIEDLGEARPAMSALASPTKNRVPREHDRVAALIAAWLLGRP